MYKNATMPRHHELPHPFLPLEKRLRAHAAFFEIAYEILLALVIIILTIALCAGWWGMRLFYPQIPPIVYNGGMETSQNYSNGSMPINYR